MFTQRSENLKQKIQVVVQRAVRKLGNKMKKTLLAGVCVSVAAFAYANTTTDSSALMTQQCKISAETVATLKNLQYGNTAIRKDVASLISATLKVQDNREVAQKAMNQMVDDKAKDASTLEMKYCS